uniref:Uncharacterized protein n=1 Tax=Ditylenchus dipsaci TaxID=166011 RepID=A0A915DZZ9_9BILA
MKKKFNRALVCLLLHLLLCQNVDSERLVEDAQHSHHKHRRRSEKDDPRLLGFHFETEPENTIVSEKKVAIFNCKYHLKSELSQVSDESEAIQLDARIEWRKDGNPINQIRSGVGRITSLSNCSLIVEDAVPSDEGIYQCAVVITLNNYPSNSACCTLNRQLKLSGTKTIEGSKMVKKASHTGSYKCIARNGAKSRTSQIATVEVVQGSSDIGAISLVLEPRSQVVRLGDSFVLECLVNGFPNQGYDVEFVGMDKTSLLVRNSTLADAGAYTCRAENGDDSVDSSATIVIRSPPTFTIVPRDETTQETSDAEFECVAEAFPKPRITWFKNGEVIVPSEYFVIGSNKLKIFGLVRDDQGVYSCLADNEVGSAQAQAQLIVDAAATHLALTAGEVVEVNSRSASLKWDPPLSQDKGSVRLYHVFFREEDSTRERTTNSTSTFTTLANLQPNSVYVVRVVASNQAGLGQSSEEIRLTTKPGELVPGKVRNLRAEVLGSETIVVDWDPPAVTSSPEALRYKLFYIKTNSSDDEKETQVLMVKTSYTLHGMDKNTRYRIRVEAEGQNGAGPSSDQLEVQTFSDVPSSPPQQIRLEATQHRTVLVRWSPPPIEHRNGVITGYKIRYDSEWNWSIFRLVWCGHSMEEREEAQIAGAPSELRVHAAYDSIQVAWLPPRDDNVMVRGYLIGWGINIPDVEKATVNSDVREYVIKSLKPNREYVISLRAFNNIGNGFPIYETVKTTAYGPSSHQSFFGSLPSAKTPHLSQMSTPVGVSAESVSSTAIRLSWTDPNEGFNQYYTVRYSSNSDNNGQVRQLNTSETEHIVDVESQQWSMSAVNKTFPAPPSSAPRDLSILPQLVEEHDDPNTIMLSWQPPKYGNGEIEEYIVLYSDRLDLPDKDWIMDSVKGDRLSMLIKNLLPKATYYFKIQARNVKGYGPFSPVATYTPENGVNHFGEFESGNGWPKMDVGRKVGRRRLDNF